MLRPFSTFPGGWAGAGLLVLRIATGTTLIIQGAAYAPELQSLQVGTWIICLMVTGSGVTVLPGFLTPIASILAAVGEARIALSWFPDASVNFFNRNPLSLDAIATTLAIVFLGPGAFSLDAHLFGRRKIIIPRSSLAAKP